MVLVKHTNSMSISDGGSAYLIDPCRIPAAAFILPNESNQAFEQRIGGSNGLTRTKSGHSSNSDSDSLRANSLDLDPIYEAPTMNGSDDENGGSDDNYTDDGVDSQQYDTTEPADGADSKQYDANELSDGADSKQCKQLAAVNNAYIIPPCKMPTGLHPEMSPERSPRSPSRLLSIPEKGSACTANSSDDFHDADETGGKANNLLRRIFCGARSAFCLG